MSTFNDGLMKAAGVTLVTEERLAALEAVAEAAGRIDEAMDQCDAAAAAWKELTPRSNAGPDLNAWSMALAEVDAAMSEATKQRNRARADLAAALDALEDQP